MAHEFGAVGVGLDTDEMGIACASSTREERRLASRPCSQIDPGGIRPFDGRIHQSQGDELAAGGRLEVIVRVADGQRFVFLGNRTDEVVEIAAPGQRVSAVEREAASVVSIAPREVVVLSSTV